jgi:acid phosphatase
LTSWFLFLESLSLTISRETDAKKDNLYARVLYSGQPVQTIHGTLGWLSLSSLIDILMPYIPADIASLCG